MNKDFLPFLKEHLGPHIEENKIKIIKLFGQASTREYFRAQLPATCNLQPATYILMKLPQGFASPADEITKTHDGAPTEFPFINVHRYLETLELPVPKIYAADGDKGIILLEDLGDDSLEAAYNKAGEAFGLVYYKKAIDLLIRLQTQTQKNPAKDCIAYFRSFDEELLNREFNHFLEYGIEDRLKVQVTDDEKKLYNSLTQNISKHITKMPQGFVHRDYQSRNLMLKDYDLTLIDFQDALMGPVLYDLVALLRDSYIVFSNDQLDTLINYYYDQLPQQHSYYDKKEALMTDFHFIALHRKLKDTGRFQFILTKRNNPGFLKNIPTSLGYVKNSFNYLLDQTTNSTGQVLTPPLQNIEELYQLISSYVEELK